MEKTKSNVLSGVSSVAMKSCYMRKAGASNAQHEHGLPSGLDSVEQEDELVAQNHA
jgi:hypothetical protein